MEQPVEITTPARARAIIAHHVLGDSRSVALGDVRLYPHQADAVGRVRTALGEFGGALLCDEVGLGKTFVALAVAQSYAEVIVVAPAVLRTMWRSAAERAHVAIAFTSIESLGRLGEGAPSRPRTRRAAGCAPGTPAAREHAAHRELVVVDEAHHARNPSTKRYAALARLCANAHTLLLTATPVHNTRTDLDTLLALPLGVRARTLPADAVGRIVIRRAEPGAATPAPRPHVLPTRWLTVPTDDAVFDALLALPAPLPPRDGGDGGPLVVHMLAHQWASSDAALLGALRRRVARATAMLAALDDGRHPTAAELRAWTYADDAVQLAFPSLLAAAEPGATALAAAVRTHADALRAVLDHLRGGDRHHADGPLLTSGDAARVAALREIRRRHPAERIVAFSQYGDTISAFYRALRADGHVAALTRSGGRVAGGTMTRAELLARFAPRAHGVTPRPRDDVTFLLTTDLLSEGVNLQDASAVVHLDLPWTAARLRQRVGRVARLGSCHANVTVYAFRLPSCAERLLRTSAILRAKADTARAVIGQAADDAAIVPPPASVPEHVEATRGIIGTWRDDRICVGHSRGVTCSHARHAVPTVPHVLAAAAVRGPRRTCLAACVVDGRPILLAATDVPAHAAGPVFTTDPAAVHAAVQLASAREPMVPSARAVHAYVSAVRAWYTHYRAAAVSGAAHVSPPGRVTRARRAALRQLSRQLATEPIRRRIALATALGTAHQYFGGPLPAGAELALLDTARSRTLPEWRETPHRAERTSSHSSVRVIALVMTEPG